MDPVTEEVEKVKKEFEDVRRHTLDHIHSIQEYGKQSVIGGGDVEKTDSLPRLNSLAQDGLKLMQSHQFNLDLLAPQLPFPDDVENFQSLAENWENEIESLRRSLRNANFQAKENVTKTTQKERELLLGGGKESTARRRDLQTKAGMTSAAESITESLRRTRQLMAQEVERSATTLMTIDESTGVLGKAEGEYKGHRSILSQTRNYLSTLQRQGVLDRVIVVVGFLAFSLAVLYVISKRLGVLMMQRKMLDVVKAGMAGRELVQPFGGRDGAVPVQDNAIPDINIPLEHMHDEL